MSFKDYQIIFELNKGFSKDQKFCVIKDNTKFLLRISKHKTWTQKEKEIEIIRKIESLDISMCKTVEYGVLDEGVYHIQTWINGTDLREVIEAMSLEEQYQLGYAAGQTLNKIHTVEVPFPCEEWSKRYNEKIDLKIKNYLECPLKYENGNIFIDYLNNNRSLLKDRPNRILHGDFHIGNFMINQNRELVIIDFEGFQYGDPWDEFDRLVWCTEKSPKFAKGMVDGYFNNDVPIAFWKTVCLYICNNIISSLPWAMNYGEEQINIMKKLAMNELRWYKDFTRIIPTWYDEN